MTMTHTYTQTGISVDWVRLEMIDSISNNAKYYVVWERPGGGYLAGFGRIGAKCQWSCDNTKSAGTQLKSKTAKGYRETASGTVTVPDSWHLAFEIHSEPAQASLRRGLWDATFSATAVVDQERPLVDLLEQCQKLVSESVANPDRAMHTFAEVIGRVEMAREDYESIEGLIETIRLLLGKGEA